MPLKIYPFFIFLFLPFASYAQLQLAWNANVDMELSKAGDLSHFYYNEIHNDLTDWHFDLTQANVMGQLFLSDQFKMSARLLVKRKWGKEFGQISIPQLNLQWFPKEKNYSLTLGRFINPYGSFNEKQLSTQRTFISIPLAYGYYHGISQQIGLMLARGQYNKISLNGEVDWGTSTVYYGGYVGGLQFSWWTDSANPTSLKVALVNGASNIRQVFGTPLNVGLVSRLKFQPTYFWQQGVSISLGSFMERTENNEVLDNLNQYYQLLIGTDYSLGTGFFSFSGEIMAAFYRVPIYSPEEMDFLSDSSPLTQTLSNISSYLDIKYEPPFLSGSFLAYRLDALVFGKIENDRYNDEIWDNHVLRHSIGVGYKLFPFLLVRGMASTQSTRNKPAWSTQQRTFRLMLTLHY